MYKSIRTRDWRWQSWIAFVDGLAGILDTGDFMVYPFLFRYSCLGGACRFSLISSSRHISFFLASFLWLTVQFSCSCTLVRSHHGLCFYSSPLAIKSPKLQNNYITLVVSGIARASFRWPSGLGPVHQTSLVARLPRSLERLHKIGNDVVDMLGADRHADGVVGDARGQFFVVGQLGVGGGPGVDGDCFGVADAAQLVLYSVDDNGSGRRTWPGSSPAETHRQPSSQHPRRRGSQTTAHPQTRASDTSWPSHGWDDPPTRDTTPTRHSHSRRATSPAPARYSHAAPHADSTSPSRAATAAPRTGSAQCPDRGGSRRARSTRTPAARTSPRTSGRGTRPTVRPAAGTWPRARPRETSRCRPRPRQSSSHARRSIWSRCARRYPRRVRSGG